MSGTGAEPSSWDPLRSWDAYLSLHQAVVGSAAAAAAGETLDRIASRVGAILSSGGRLIVAGNGGSASDANHIVGELVASFAYERRGIDAISLSTNATVLTAWTNDYDAASVFARQVEAHLREGDALLLLSTSGESPNILNAARTGRSKGGYIVGFTGVGPNGLTSLCDESVCASTSFTPAVQEFHVVAYHYLCAAIERACLDGQSLVPRYQTD